MIAFYKKYYKTAFDISLMIVTVYLFMLLFSLLYRIATPVFLALLIFACIEPFARFLHRKGMKKSVASALSAFAFILLVTGAFVGAGIIFAAQIHQLSLFIPQYSHLLQNAIVDNAAYLKEKIGTLDPAVVEKAQEYAALLAQKASQLAAGLLSSIFGLLSSLSTFVVNFAIGLILAYFLSIEIEDWKKISAEKTPKTFKKAYYFLKENVIKGIVSYIKAQLKLISLTFVIIFAALLLLGVHNAFAVALLSAFFDLLPLLGVSTVFIPWITYWIIVGNTRLAIELAVLLAIVILVRQILEPKITGESLGVSAFTMLSFMIVSLSLFGVAGLILSPVLIILIKALIEQGYLRRWIRLPEEEFDT